MKNSKNSWLYGLLGSDINLILYLLFFINAKKHVPPEEYSKYRAIWFLSIGASLLSIVVYALLDKNKAILLCQIMAVFSSFALFWIMLRIRENSFLSQVMIAGPLKRRLLSKISLFIFLAMSIYIFTKVSEESVVSIFKWFMSVCSGFIISGRLAGLLWLIKKEV